MSIIPGLVDFSVRLVNSLSLLQWGRRCSWEIQIKKVLCKIEFRGLVRVTFRPVLFVIVVNSLEATLKA